MQQQAMFDEPRIEVPPGSLAERAAAFCREVPHRAYPFARRDWGGALHSLCSYQGKLKPSIAHFLITWFTNPCDRVLDPMSGVGTIPLEARREGRVGIANDLSPVADCVSRAKLETFSDEDVIGVTERLDAYIRSGPTLESLSSEVDVEFGLNGAICDYFHPETLREVVLARRFFIEGKDEVSPSARDVVRSSVLHMLHGNRPYALSRRSHPVTPFAPTGPFEYRSLMDRLVKRLHRVVPVLIELGRTSPPGRAIKSDFRTMQIDPVDAVITSPPFAKSVRFWSVNWMRLWFAGWDPEDFKSEPARYLETEQKHSFDPYASFAEAMAQVLKPAGLLILHLGETALVNMADSVAPLIATHFEVIYSGKECVRDTESHGLRDKGSTVAHHYLFAIKR